MTDAEKDAAWRSLPEDIRMEIGKGYNELKSCKHITADRRNGAMAAYENIFGTHNLTATEEKKPRFKVGDKVVTTENGPLHGAGWSGVIDKIDGIWAVIRMFTEDEVVFFADIDHLVPYTEEQEQEDGENAAYMEEMLAGVRKGCVSHIQTLKDLEKKLKSQSMDNDTPKSSPPDWLDYRMELAKEVVKEAMRFEGISNSERVAYHTIAIVDGIVERLKGGEK